MNPIFGTINSALIHDCIQAISFLSDIDKSSLSIHERREHQILDKLSEEFTSVLKTHNSITLNGGASSLPVNRILKVENVTHDLHGVEAVLTGRFVCGEEISLNDSKVRTVKENLIATLRSLESATAVSDLIPVLSAQLDFETCCGSATADLAVLKDQRSHSTEKRDRLLQENETERRSREYAFNAWGNQPIGQDGKHSKQINPRTSYAMKQQSACIHSCARAQQLYIEKTSLMALQRDQALTTAAESRDARLRRGALIEQVSERRGQMDALRLSLAAMRQALDLLVERTGSIERSG